ncbi:MAG: NAD-dependent epimerase/dehydratase family protein, partial [Solirubrobacterales bacterium]
MRVVVTGASGNVGTSLLAHLSADPEIDSTLGLARRLPQWRPEKVEWRAADVASDELEPIFAGADAVVHLAWAIQPSRDDDALEAVNVRGSERVFRAAAAAGVPRLVHASSVGAYSPGPKDRAVDESHPTGGVSTSFYSRHKAAVESILDAVEAESPEMGVARLRPGLIFKREAATGIRRYFAGPLLPNALVRRERVPLVPNLDRLRFQAVHSLDV